MYWVASQKRVFVDIDVERWTHHFRHNQLDRPEPAWDASIIIPPEVIEPLVRSLEQFHLGDGGGPAGLIARNAESFRSSSDAFRQLIDAWFNEEKEHSRLLSRAVKRFGGTPISGHWSFSAFCLVRRWFGVRCELTVLLLTEIVSTAYYRLLHRHGNDAALRAMCSLILRDEAGHIAFHRDRLARKAANSASHYGKTWATRHYALGYAAATMLWVNHARGLKAMGGSRREFYREVRGELRRFTSSLRRETDALAGAGKVSLCNA